MNRQTAANLFSEHRLSEATLAFLETVKFQPFHLENAKRFEIIDYVNRSPSIVEKIFNSEYQTGFHESVRLLPLNRSDQLVNALEKINLKRRSNRRFSPEKLSFAELSDFLSLFYSITGEEKVNLRGKTLTRRVRNIASGGGIYATEIFLAIDKVAQLRPGIYRYNVYDAKLECYIVFDSADKLEEFYSILMVDKNKKSEIDYKNTAAFIIFTAILNKHAFKYRDFGVILSLVEVGAFIHSAYLSAAALDISCCAYGGMLNDKMNDFLGLKNDLHYPLMYMSIGNRV